MKKITWSLFLMIGVGWLLASSGALAADQPRPCWGFGCYHSQLTPQVLGEQINDSGSAAPPLPPLPPLSPQSAGDQFMPPLNPLNNQGGQVVNNVCRQGESQVPCPVNQNDNSSSAGPNMMNNPQPPQAGGAICWQGDNQVPCPNNQSQQSQPQFNNFDNGDWEKQQAKQAEQQKKMDEQRLRQMKKEMTNFLKQVGAAKTRAAKAKVAVPDDVNQALSDLGAYDAVVKQAADPSEIDDVRWEISDRMQTVQEFMNMIPMLQQIPRELKNADKNYQNYVKSLAKLKKQASKVKNLDLSQTLADYQTALDQAKATLTEAQAEVTTDPASVMDTLRGFYDDDLQTVREKQRIVEFSVNFTQGLKSFTSLIKNFDSRLKQAERKKLDAGDAKEQLADIKNQFNAIKQAAAKPVDFEEIQVLVEDFSLAVNDLNDLFNELLGTSDFQPVMPKPPANQQINLPTSLYVAPDSIDNGQSDNGGGPALAPGTY